MYIKNIFKILHRMGKNYYMYLFNFIFYSNIVTKAEYVIYIYWHKIEINFTIKIKKRDNYNNKDVNGIEIASINKKNYNIFLLFDNINNKNNACNQMEEFICILNF